MHGRSIFTKKSAVAAMQNRQLLRGRVLDQELNRREMARQRIVLVRDHDERVRMQTEEERRRAAWEAENGVL